MGSCPQFPCFASPKPKSESQSSEQEHTKSEKEDTKTVTRKSAKRDKPRSLSCDVGPDASNLTSESEQGCSKSKAKKPKIGKFNTVDTLKHDSVSPNVSPKGPFRISNVKPFAGKAAVFPDITWRSFEKERGTLMISDWGDCYEDEVIRMSNTSNPQRTSGDNWSEWTSSPKNGPNRLGGSLVVKAMFPEQKMIVSPGMVWAMLRTKDGHTFQLLNLSISLQTLVDTFLKAETGLSLPVSFTFFNDTQPKLFPGKNMGMTLSENLKGYLDEKTQGLSFFLGSVDTKLCYKMFVNDLEQFQKLFSMQREQYGNEV